MWLQKHIQSFDTGNRRKRKQAGMKHADAGECFD